MKLQCSVMVLNRLLPSLSMKCSTKYKNAVISIVKPGRDSEIYLILFTQKNKRGCRYKICNNIEKTFGQFSHEGKCTIRFKEPCHDLCISADTIPLKNLMLYIKKIWRGELGVSPTAVKEGDITPRFKQKSYKLEIKNKEDYPVLKGFPRNLQYLSVCDCKLSKFDSRILKLQNLTVLALSKNRLKTIPEELGTLQIQHLYLDNNDLKSDNWRFFSGTALVKALKTLDLSSNQITSIPPSLSRFTSLKSLKVSKNRLKAIPFRLCLLPELQELDLSFNDISALPGTIIRKYLKKLHVLDVSGNGSLSKSQQMYTPIHRKTVHNPVFSLLELAGQRVIESKIWYNEEVVAFDLVKLLDSAGQCFCGKTTVKSYGLLSQSAEVKSIASTFVSTDRQLTVPIVYMSCAPNYNTSA